MLLSNTAIIAISSVVAGLICSSIVYLLERKKKTILIEDWIKSRSHIICTGINTRYNYNGTYDFWIAYSYLKKEDHWYEYIAKGKTLKEARRNYIKKIAGKYIYFTPHQRKHQIRIKVPKNIR